MGEAALVKTFRANSLNEALRLVKSELGDEAVILSTRKLRRAWPARDRGVLEVRAALPAGAARNVHGRKDGTGKAGGAGQEKVASLDVKQLAGLQAAISRMYEQVRKSRLEKVAEQDFYDRFMQNFRQEVEQATATLRSLVAEAHLVQSTGLPPAQASVIRQLVDNGVEPGYAEAIVRAAPQDSEDIDVVRRAVARFLLRYIPVAPSLQVVRGRRVAAFVGPTGVGKTTTVAKIAAAAMITGRRVGLVSCDTWRLGGAEQLKAYAECMKLPFEVADGPMQVRRALERMENRNLVLIDTPGVGTRQADRFGTIQAMVSRAWVDELHLVLSAHGGIEDIHAWRRLFGPQKPDRLVVTKLDDVERYGILFNGPVMLGSRLSYLCAGQRVPEDLEVATAERAVRLLLSASSGRRGGAR